MRHTSVYLPSVSSSKAIAYLSVSSLLRGNPSSLCYSSFSSRHLDVDDHKNDRDDDDDDD